MSDEHIQKLKQILGENRYKMFVDIQADEILSDLAIAFEDYGIAFEEWIDQLEEDVRCGDININISDDEFKRVIENRLSATMGGIFYS